jgi:hypothetical protein
LSRNNLVPEEAPSIVSKDENRSDARQSDSDRATPAGAQPRLSSLKKSLPLSSITIPLFRHRRAARSA